MSLHPPPTAYDTFSPLPSDLLSPADYKNDPFNDHPLANGSSTTPTTSTAATSTSVNGGGGFNDAFFNLRSQSFDARSNDLVVSPRAFSLYPRSTNRVGSSSAAAMHGLMQDTAVSASLGGPISSSVPDSDPFGYLSKSSPVMNDSRANGSASFFETAIANGSTNTDILSSRMNSLLINTNNNNGTNGSNNNNSSNGISSDLRAAPSMSSPSNYRGSISSSSNNPADQNPPCNTLYVGNLPPYTSEDELRQLFSKCTNFKRLLFRSKNQQGPMCFVEFEDVVYATQAMNELQGHTLSNSVKGGIRLSFSKNPLFTKPNGANGTTTTATPTATTTSTGSTNSNNSNSNKKGGDSFMF